MLQTVFITGHDESEKRKQMLDFITPFNRNEITYIPLIGRYATQNPYLFQRCTPLTKLLIIETVHSLDQLEEFMKMFKKSILVNKKNEETFFIEPRVIFVCSGIIEAQHIATSPEIESIAHDCCIVSYL